MKTELIILRLPWRQLLREPDIRLINCKLKLHTHVKYLGIFTDEVFSQNKQIDILHSKLSRANGRISKLPHLAPLNTCLSVCYSIFCSHLFHNFLAWSNTKEININQVNKLQRRFVQILAFSDFDGHVIDLFAKLLKVQDVLG